MNKDRTPSLKSRLRQERLLRGWSQRELADQLGTTMVTVSRWERGTQSPGPLMRLKLCRIFGKTEHELVMFPEENERVAPSSSYDNQHAVVSTPATDASADGASEVIIQAEPGALHFTQETGRVLPSPETEKQARVPTLLARLSPLTPFSSWFSHLRPSFQWMSMLACLLLLALMTSFLLELSHLPKALSKNPVVTPFPTAATEQVPAPYGVSGHLVFDNALSNEQTGRVWALSDPRQANGCHFLNSAYDMRDVESNYCLASNTDFANFVYQIEMTTLQGSSGQRGRILFRADDAQDAYYAFEVGIDGSYRLVRNDLTGEVVLREGHSSAILQGDWHPNLLAVKASGKDLFLYVNLQLVAHVQDLSYTHGNIGVGIVVSTQAQETEVTFRQAKVWAL